MTGDQTAVPRQMFPFVDIRDVAAAHVNALTCPQAANQRLIVSAANLWFADLAHALALQFRHQGAPLRHGTSDYWRNTTETDHPWAASAAEAAPTGY